MTSEWKKYTEGSVKSDFVRRPTVISSSEEVLVEVYAYCVLCLNLASLALLISSRKDCHQNSY